MLRSLQWCIIGDMRHVWLILLLALGPGLANAGAAEGPGFDCGKASAPLEHLICGSQDYLAPLDLQLVRSYRRAQDVAGKNRDRLLRDQRDWLRQRTVACPVDMATEQTRTAADVCLSRLYVRRIAVLDRLYREATATQQTQLVLPSPQMQVKLLGQIHIREKVLTVAPTPEQAMAFDIMDPNMADYLVEHSRREDVKRAVPVRLTCPEWMAVKGDASDNYSMGLEIGTTRDCRLLEVLAQGRPARQNFLTADPTADLRLLPTTMLASPLSDDMARGQHRFLVYPTFGAMEQADEIAIYEGKIHDGWLYTDRLDENVAYVKSYEGELRYACDGNYHYVRPIARGDFNNDGIEDLLVTLSYKAIAGSWGFSEVVLLSRLSADSPIKAMAMPPTEWMVPERADAILNRQLPPQDLYRADDAQ
jgi:uncharacterized protein